MKEDNNKKEDFKRTLGIVTKTISKNKKIEINFENKNSSINENIVNIKDFPGILSIENISQIRGEADSIGSQIRYHNSKIHKKYIKDESQAKKIFDYLERSRCEALGSYSFKGIYKNIKNKFINDYNNKTYKDLEIEELFYLCSFMYFTNKKLGKDFEKYKNFYNNKLGKKIKPYFKELEKKIDNQEEFANKATKMLSDLGFDLIANPNNDDKYNMFEHNDPQIKLFNSDNIKSDVYNKIYDNNNIFYDTFKDHSCYNSKLLIDTDYHINNIR